MTGQKIRDGKALKFERGMPVGHTPVGYHPTYAISGSRRVVTGIVVDEDRAPIIRDALHRYATGSHSLREIASWAESEGFRMPSGTVAGMDTWRGILLRRPQYMGQQVSGRTGKRVDTALPARVSGALWHRCQVVARSRRGGVPTGITRRHYPLRGLVYCPRGHRLTGQTTVKDRRGRPVDLRYYRHERSRAPQEVRSCDGVNVRADRLEATILDYLAALQPDEVTVDAAYALLQESQQDPAAPELAKIARRRAPRLAAARV